MRSSRIIKKAVSGWEPFPWPAGSEPLAAAKIAQRKKHPEGAEKEQEAIPVQVLEEERRRAHERGYAEGAESGLAEHEEALSAVRAELTRTVAELSLVRSTIYRDAQADLLHLATAIARRILHRELLVSPDILQGIISVILEKLDRQEIYRVRVHPAMAAGVEDQLKRRPHHKGIQVIPDSSMAPGGCVFETGRGNIDAGIESQLSEIERGLADHLEA